VRRTTKKGARAAARLDAALAGELLDEGVEVVGVAEGLGHDRVLVQDAHDLVWSRWW
jgi:hypothetical protein